jgi:hypothetical protein
MVMEIKEIVSYYVDTENEVLEVYFRTTDDDEDSIRTDEIDLNETKDFAYSLDFKTSDFEMLDEEIEDNVYESDIVIEPDQIISFLNEYYTVFPVRLPKSELF